MCVCVCVQVSVLLGNWQQVLNYYNKAEASIDSTDVSKTCRMINDTVEVHGIGPEDIEH